MSKRLLVLENGSVYEGIGFGGNDYKVGELVFHTGMIGYEDVLSNVANYAQIVMMTYPMVGNYGINAEDFAAIQPGVFGLVVGEYCETPSNWRSEISLNDYLTQQNIPGLSDIDTRKLTRELRNEGSMKAIMADESADVEAIVDMLKTAQLPTDQVAKVVKQDTYKVNNEKDAIVVVNFGDCDAIVKELTLHGKNVVVVPYTISADEIVALQPAGVMLSNGPGNPQDLPEVVAMLQTLMDKVVIFGINLGHQLLCLACGATTSKLKFGHRGGNHPVLHLASNKTEIVSQNHAYVVDEHSLCNAHLMLTHTALNDKSVEGVKHDTLPMMAVQYNPIRSVNKEEINYLYAQFYMMIEANKEGK